MSSAAAFALLLGAANLADATVYTLANANDSVVGEDTTVVTVYEDTLYDLARKLSLGSEELIRVNPGVDPWLPGAGKTLVVPGRHILPEGPRDGIVVNLPEHRLYYYPKPNRDGTREVITYPVSIGKMDWHTPLGLTHVIQKIKDPSWYPPESVRKEHAAAGDPLPPVVRPGPDNPLGKYAMRLAAGNGSYLIHGTNNPIAVGMAVTHGCIRMYPDDVQALFPLIPVGTPVHLINEPVKVAWVDGELLLEAHPPVDAEGQSFEPQLDQFSDLLQKAVGDTTVAIHWDYAREVLQKADGVIATVGLEADLSAEAPTNAPPDFANAPPKSAKAPPDPADAPRESPAASPDSADAPRESRAAPPDYADAPANSRTAPANSADVPPSADRPSDASAAASNGAPAENDAAPMYGPATPPGAATSGRRAAVPDSAPASESATPPAAGSPASANGAATTPLD